MHTAMVAVIVIPVAKKQFVPAINRPFILQEDAWQDRMRRCIFSIACGACCIIIIDSVPVRSAKQETVLLPCWFIPVSLAKPHLLFGHVRGPSIPGILFMPVD